MELYQETSIPDIFLNRVDRYGDRACVAYKNVTGVYEDISWKKMKGLVLDIGCYLLSKGIRHGDKVALFSNNRYEWWVADLAILSCGAVNVPIYPSNSAEEARYIIENSDARICFAGSSEHLLKILSVRDKLPGLAGIVALDTPEESVPGVASFSQALKEGKAFSSKDLLDKRIQSINMGDIASIIYTSGTTGNPKGVILTHRSFVTNIKQCYAVAPTLFDQDHTMLSFLPLSHCYERLAGYYMPLYTGKKVVFAEEFSKILQNFQEVRPTLIVCVPRLFEKIHTGIMSKAEAAAPRRKKLFRWALDVARRNLDYICNDKTRKGLFAIEYALADKIVFSKIKAALGMDRLQFGLSGGGPLSKTDAEFFLGMGIKILEGYGLTETGPVSNVNRPEKIKPGTVGPPLVDTEIRISDEGEVLIKGPQLMSGYYKDEAATREVFTEDGHFRSGDIGEVDADGFLKITGRIKDLIITSGGKNISPQNIENSIKGSRYIEQIAVIGDNRKYLTALVVPAFAELEQWAASRGIVFSTRQELIENDDVRQLVSDEIKLFTRDLARVEQIKKFTLLADEWSQETDELTPTLKLKRRVLNMKYASEISRMYPEEGLQSQV
jgi:long-chain acyl-CoA synthetase